MATKRTRQPVAVDVFDKIRAVAQEHAMTQDATTCICKHIQGVHLNHWGRCTGDRGKCGCVVYRGIRWNKVREFERYGLALVARLRGTT